VLPDVDPPELLVDPPEPPDVDPPEPPDVDPPEPPDVDPPEPPDVDPPEPPDVDPPEPPEPDPVELPPEVDPPELPDDVAPLGPPEPDVEGDDEQAAAHSAAAITAAKPLDTRCAYITRMNLLSLLRAHVLEINMAPRGQAGTSVQPPYPLRCAPEGLQRRSFTVSARP
jgi:hypothetical protein